MDLEYFNSRKEKAKGIYDKQKRVLSPYLQSQKDGFSVTKIAEYFGFVAIVGEKKIKIRVIIRRIGDGNFTFWSVMPDSKLKGGQKLYDYGIEDD